MGVAVRDFEFVSSVFNVKFHTLGITKIEFMFETLFLGFFGSFLFVVNRMKPKTIKQKIRDVVRSGVLGVPASFKCVVIDDFLMGMFKYQGDFVSEKRPLHLHLATWIASLVSKKLRMGMQFLCSAIVSIFCCLRQSEFSVSDAVAVSVFFLVTS